jgi:4-hydroxybenzoate polyprenyltransferase
MKLLSAFLRLIRWPNLVFIVVAQVFFYRFIVANLLHDNAQETLLSNWQLIWLMAASVFIAAGGYVINDYFDLNIDLVNKPEKLVVDKIIRRRWVIIWHLVLSGAGLLCSFVVSWQTGLWWIVIINFFCICLLFLYSISLKRKLLSGNVLISLLTAWVILILCLIEVQRGGILAGKIFRLGFLYAGFAFVTSLVREVVKDLEDMEGDAKHGCRTAPIVWGITAAKIYTAVWITVLLGLLLILQFYVLQYGWYIAIGYALLLLVAPLVWLLRGLREASSPADYHRLSSVIKAVMLAGILSMSFFEFYH